MPSSEISWTSRRILWINVLRLSIWSFSGLFCTESIIFIRFQLECGMAVDINSRKFPENRDQSPSVTVHAEASVSIPFKS